MDAAGNLYLADSANHRIRRISTTGVITTVAGQGTQAFLGDGAPAVSASLDTPRAVAISPAGLLTLTDTANQRIRQLDALPAPGPDIHTLTGLVVTPPPVVTASDFTLTATGATAQSVPAGSAATFNFSVATQGAALTSPIVISVQGIPHGASSSINPPCPATGRRSHHLHADHPDPNGPAG